MGGSVGDPTDSRALVFTTVLVCFSFGFANPIQAILLVASQPTSAKHDRLIGF